MARILVAEDDANFRRILTHVLKINGFDVMEAKDGLEALEMAENEKPDLIIMDVMMPRLHGIDATRRIRGNPATKTIPIIMCTARDGKKDVMEAIKAGADDYIVKPSRHQVYIQKIRKALVPRERRMLALAPGSERRKTARVRVEWSAIWSITGPDGMRLDFKNPVYDVSIEGLALEFDRCATCTGYEIGTVHKECLLAPWALRLEPGRPVDIVLMVDRSTTLDLQGKIAHVYQPEDWPTTEIVGICFTQLSEAARELISKHTY